MGLFLKAVYTIGILNFSFPDQSERERCLREIQLLDRETNEVFYEKLTLIYLEVPKFKKAADELITLFDKWMYVLRNLHRLQERPVQLQEKVFEKLFSEAEIAKLNPADMKTYQESLKVFRDNYNSLETAKKEGREEGRKEGRKMGIQEGIENTARKMKKEGISLEVISRITGLTPRAGRESIRI